MSPAKSFVERATSFVIDLASLALACPPSERTAATAGWFASATPVPPAGDEPWNHVTCLLEGRCQSMMQGPNRGQPRHYAEVAASVPRMRPVFRKNEAGKISPRLIFL
jgi:hypothetical protein